MPSNTESTLRSLPSLPGPRRAFTAPITDSTVRSLLDGIASDARALGDASVEAVREEVRNSLGAAREAAAVSFEAAHAELRSELASYRAELTSAASSTAMLYLGMIFIGVAVTFGLTAWLALPPWLSFLVVGVAATLISRVSTLRERAVATGAREEEDRDVSRATA